jgi:uncharacterized protein YggE
MKFEAKDKNYDRAMGMAAEQIANLKQVLTKAGFEKDALKTTDFKIRTDYDRVKDRNQTYISVFAGYECSHDAKLVFDFEMKRLGAALGAIAESAVKPTVNIDFTVKNPAAVNERLLQDATRNARKKADILCAAAGAELGQLLDISYNWNEISLYAETKYLAADCVPCYGASDIEIDPDDIHASDTVTFVWEIV